MEVPGLMLKREREARGLTLAELARVTRIPETALENIENNDFDRFPAEVFVRGFLRNYARQLSISSEEIMASYESWMRQQSSQPVVPEQEAAGSDELRTPSVSETRAANDDVPVHSMRFAYIAIVLIAVASVGLSLFFMNTGEAEEGSVDFMVQPGETMDSPFLISNTSEGWLAE